MNILGKPVMRTAVYTRKSSDEGLYGEFNSMDAKYEVWKLIKKRYDDGVSREVHWSALLHQLSLLTNNALK